MLGWYLIEYRARVRKRREVQLNTYKRILRKVDVALDAFVAVDPLERMMVENVRNAILDWYASTDSSIRQRVKAGSTARRRISLELAVQQSWILLDSSSNEARTFYREASKALRDNEKEIPT